MSEAEWALVYAELDKLTRLIKGTTAALERLKELLDKTE